MDKKVLLLGLLGATALFLWSRRGQSLVSDVTGSTTAQTILDPVFEVFSNMTRGERNNNPGNIRKSASPWAGKVDGQDSAFETFSSPEYGIRALGRLMQNYATQGYNNVVSIISRYAPSSENDTGAYVNSVANQMGVAPAQPLDLSDAVTLRALVDAIITHENGRNIYADTGQLDAGISMV